MSDDQFDPEAVPSYPVYRLEIDEQGRALVDGIPVADGHDAPELAIAHLAGLIREAGLAAARVLAVTTEGTHRMVVEADGTPHELVDETPANTMAIGGRRISRRAVLATAATAAGLAILGVATPLTITLLTPPPKPVATVAPPPGQGAQIPVLAPPGYGQNAAWALEVSSRSVPTFLPDGRIAVTNTGGDLRIVDPATGKTTWKGSGSPRTGASLHPTSIGGRDVLATAATTQLTVWPLYLGAGTTSSVSYDLPRGAVTTFLGTEPLVVLPDQTVGFVTASGLVRQDVPVTATPILATKGNVIAVDATAIYTLTPKGEVSHRALTIPAGATKISKITAADADTLIVVWDNGSYDTKIVSTINVSTGQLLIDATVPAGDINSYNDPLHAIDGKTLTYGSVFIRYDNEPRITALGSFTPTAITGSIVYGTTNREAARIDLTSSDDPTASLFTTEKLPLDPIAPSAINAEMAWIVADKVDATYLYALPRTGSTVPTVTPSSTPTPVRTPAA